eukprot:3362598-Pleurochrysis_carterae.AAC.1
MSLLQSVYSASETSATRFVSTYLAIASLTMHCSHSLRLSVCLSSYLEEAMPAAPLLIPMKICETIVVEMCADFGSGMAQSCANLANELEWTRKMSCPAEQEA